MKPFDPNCKPGTELRHKDMSSQIYFIGFARNGCVVYEYENGGTGRADASGIFMVPRKVVKWSLFNPSCSPTVSGFALYSSEEEANQVKNKQDNANSLLVCRIEWEE